MRKRLLSRRRRSLAGLFVSTIALGVASRRIQLGIALWDKTAGDVLYAVAVYLSMAFVAVRASDRAVAGVAFLTCLAVEVFQVTGIPLELSRTHPWVHWLLGSTFAWHDVACYAVGVALAALITRRHPSRLVSQ